MPNIFRRISHALQAPFADKAKSPDHCISAAILEELKQLEGERAGLSCRAPAASMMADPFFSRPGESPDYRRLSDMAVAMKADMALEPDFVADCVDLDFRRVVDLRSTAEKRLDRPGPFDGGKKSIRAGQHENQAARITPLRRETRLEGVGSKAGHGHVRHFSISLSGHDGSPAPAGSYTLSWIRVHAGSGKEISAQLLFDTSVHLALTAPDQGGETVFLCADGQRTCATFAAAQAILHRHLGRPIAERELPALISDKCLEVQAAHQPVKFRSEDIESLLGFGRLMIKSHRCGELSRLQRLHQLRNPPAPTSRSPTAAPLPQTSPPLGGVKRTFRAPPKVVRPIPTVMVLPASPTVVLPPPARSPEPLSATASPRSILKPTGVSTSAPARGLPTFAEEARVRTFENFLGGRGRDGRFTRIVKEAREPLNDRNGAREVAPAGPTLSVFDSDGVDV